MTDIRTHFVDTGDSPTAHSVHDLLLQVTELVATVRLGLDVNFVVRSTGAVSYSPEFVAVTLVHLDRALAGLRVLKTATSGGPT